MKRNDQISSLLLALFGAMISAGGFRLELGSMHNPGPGFLPFWAGLILCGISLGVFIEASSRKRESTAGVDPIWSGIRWRNLLLVFASMVLYANLLNTLGFILSTWAAMFVWFKSDESQRWSVSLGGSLLAVLAAYTLFEWLLKADFPKGLLNF